MILRNTHPQLNTKERESYVVWGCKRQKEQKRWLNWGAHLVGRSQAACCDQQLLATFFVWHLVGNVIGHCPTLPRGPSRPGDLIGREGPKRAPNDPNTNPLYISTKHKRMRSASQQRYSGFAKMARRAAARVKHPKCGFIMGSFSKTINDRPSDKLTNTLALIIGRPLSHSLSHFTPPVEGFGKVRGLHEPRGQN